MSSDFPRHGEWVCFRGNQSLDAHSQAVGNITAPAIAWKHFVGLIENILVVEPHDGDAIITVPGEKSPARLAEIEAPRWGLAPPPRQGDGKSEFLIQSDFSKHVEGLGHRDGTLQPLWQREIEPDISDPQIVMRVNPNPVGDIDGDGRLEVLLNLYNEGGDGR